MIYPHTPYEDWFNGRDEYPEIWIRDSVHRPSSLKDPARVLSEDRDAARLIDELENLIGSLRRYRRDLTKTARPSTRSRKPSPARIENKPSNASRSSKNPAPASPPTSTLKKPDGNNPSG